MLIHLDHSAAADAESGSATATSSRACIENLLLAHFEGNHVLSIDPGDAATLRAVVRAERAQAAIERIDASYAEIAGLRADVSWSLELGLGPRFDDGVRQSPGTKVILAPLHRFQNLRTTSPAVLLGENMTDAELFRQLGLMRRALRGWEAVDMRHEPGGTGGSTFFREYKQRADQGGILLAIADGDEHHPHSGFGETFNKLKAEATGRPMYQRARAHPARTAEGLVPLEVYREAFAFPHERPGDSRPATLARLEQFFRSAPATIRRHADLKNGLTVFQIDNPKNAIEGAYWSEIARGAGRDHCSQPAVNRCAERKECKCHVIDGVGADALAAVLAWSESRKSKKSLAGRFGLEADAELSALADEILAWGLALPPVLA